METKSKKALLIVGMLMITGIIISQPIGSPAEENYEKMINCAECEPCCCCIDNILSTTNGLPALEKQTLEKAKRDRGKHQNAIVCIFDKSKGKICCSNGTDVKCCEAFSGDKDKKQNEEGGPIPNGKWLIDKLRIHATKRVSWFNLHKEKECDTGKYYQYDEEIKEYGTRIFLGLHPGKRSTGCITVSNESESNKEEKGLVIDPESGKKTTQCWVDLMNLIKKGTYIHKVTQKFSGFLYVQECPPCFSEEVKNDNSEIELEVTKHLGWLEYLFSKKYLYRWRYRITKTETAKIKDFCIDGVPDDPTDGNDWGNWWDCGWKRTITQDSKTGKWKICWETNKPVDGVILGFDNRWGLGPAKKGKSVVSNDKIRSETGSITVPRDKPATKPSGHDPPYLRKHHDFSYP